jgi:trigger factor
VESLARQKKLQPTPEDITSYFADLSDKTNIAMDKIKSYYSGPEKQSELEFKLMEEKVLSYLKENATIES